MILTHDEIVERLNSTTYLREGCGLYTGKIYKHTIQDYVSMCFACGMTQVEVKDMVKCNSDLTASQIDSSIKLYLNETYRDRPVKVDGVRYESILDASEKIGVHNNTIREWLKTGKAIYY